ncbi:SAPS-domain-containing protein [Xylona heveae TC161]|uniref:SAPS-domain-containing protein n=1 Tax=Xylona heveae (strain CBS 132557 / TC161) TaxID=1328760 RepID=A0A165IIV1_XYLHT|nr:SAPS-domain-containing protein [Xylona heveae TC161]KZF24954.1 SAPS-domain-containing protein [Xylona heveae TC161]
MFWRFGGYANISTIDTILDKPDVSLEELLDESDLIQELKQNNSKLIEYLREEDILRRLLQYVIAPKLDEDATEGSAIDDSTDQDPVIDPEWHLKEEKAKVSRRRMTDEERDRQEKTRLKYAYVACEILSSETWSILEALMEYQHHLRDFWTYLKRPAPLDPLQAGYFTKVNETLLDKKTEEMLEFFKSVDNVVPDMLKHVDCPMIMDLLLKIISLEKAEGGQGIVNWLQSQDIVPILLSCLAPGNSTSTQTSAGDFIKAVITISANASQNEQSCIGPNNLTRQLVSEPCISKLISDMLSGGNSLTVGVGIVIEVIRKNNSDYDPEIGTGPDAIPSSRDPIYLGTLLRAFAKHVPDFMNLILNPDGSADPAKPGAKRQLNVAFGGSIEPLGFDRFKTCELMAELLHCSNMALLNECGSDAFMKARDAERERLKADGRLDLFGEDHPGGDFEHDASYANGASPSRRSSESPEEIRKLEVQNGGEEDGFEDVAVSGVLNEDGSKDNEKAEAGHDSRDSDDPFADRETDDDDANDFVDEPLSSPRLNPRASLKISDDELSSLVSPEPTDHDPLSPTSAGITGRVGELGLQHDATMTSPPPGSADEEQAGSAPKPVPVPVQTNSPVKEHPEIIGGAPDDRPAPLFANRATLPENLQASPEESGDGVAEGYAGAASHEGDTSIRSGSMSGEEARYGPESTELHIELEEDGSPVVGDYLKMMFIQHKVVPTIIDFFFRFPWNNFLHNVVYDVVQQVFNGPMNRGRNRNLAFDLFDTGRITEKIVEGQRRSDKAQAETSIRLGYMGHLTLIAEEVVKFTERHPPEMLSQSVLDKVMHQDWITYVEQTLAETRERDNAILGGVRPDMSVGSRQAVMNAVSAGFGGSSALANAGLNGGNGLDSMELNHGSTTSGGFSISGGSLLSGFGSSSDEEDEEMEEGEEDDGAHRGSNAPGSDHVGELSFEDVDMGYR